MKCTLAVFAFLVAGAGCSSPDADPYGNWQVTLTFGDGNCSGLPATSTISFSITELASSYEFADTGTTTDTFGGLLVCGGDSCTLELSDIGAGDEESNISMQTLSATLTLENNQVSGPGMVMFDLSDGTTCTQQFTTGGDVQ